MPTDVAERLTGRGPFRVSREEAPLADRRTVQGWLRELRPDRDQQVLVHRSWGTVAAVAGDHRPVTVVMSDGKNSWYAVPPGAADDQALTPGQVEHIMLDALSSSGPPEWPDWRSLG
jgi:hypothetical protein